MRVLICMSAPLQPRPISDDWQWQEQAACRNMPSAKAVCASCPVIQACRKQALELHEPYGIWGGLSEDDRLALINGKTSERYSTAS